MVTNIDFPSHEYTASVIAPLPCRGIHCKNIYIDFLNIKKEDFGINIKKEDFGKLSFTFSGFYQKGYYDFFFAEKTLFLVKPLFTNHIIGYQST